MRLAGLAGSRRCLSKAAARTDALLRHVNVRKAPDGSHYYGTSLDLGWGRVYGGQTMAQAVSAAQAAVGTERSIHQLSGHFLKGGDVQQGIRFETDVLSHGRSFSVVHVRALQQSERLLTLTASFQVPEIGLEHQYQEKLAREWGRPDELEDIETHMAPFAARMPEKIRKLYSEGPIQLRPSKFIAPWDTTPSDAVRAFWLRIRGAVPDDDHAHQCLLTCGSLCLQTRVYESCSCSFANHLHGSPSLVHRYLSDWGLLETSLLPLQTAAWIPQMQVASLSHSIHFHHPSNFRLDKQWLCHVMRSPCSSGGRGFALGEMWTEDGILVASTAQEGLIRLRRSE